MLNKDEKDALYDVIAAVLGEDNTLKSYRSVFNEDTVDVVENMVEANFQCNAGMKALIKGLLGGATGLTKGWLRKFIKKSRSDLSGKELKGYGCLASVKARWKTIIISSTI